MDIKKLQTIVVNALDDVKAQDVKVYDTTGITSLFDRICIASGTSNRQTKALAAAVREQVKEHGGDIVGIEGDDIGEWVLVDLGDMVVHIMQPIIRDYYRLEELWGEKEIKLGAAKRTSKSGLVKASEEEVKKPRSNINQAIQASVDDDVKPAKKPRTPRAKPQSDTSSDVAVKKPAPRKKAIGTTVKVAPSKSAIASAKQASEKRATRAPAKPKRTPSE